MSVLKTSSHVAQLQEWTAWHFSGSLAQRAVKQSEVSGNAANGHSVEP